MDWVLLLKQFLSFKVLIPFVPIFVAVDVLGILPIFVSLTLEMEITARRRVVRQSLLTAFLVSMGFLVAGKSVFTLWGFPFPILRLQEVPSSLFYPLLI